MQTPPDVVERIRQAQATAAKQRQATEPKPTPAVQPQSHPNAIIANDGYGLGFQMWVLFVIILLGIFFIGAALGNVFGALILSPFFVGAYWCLVRLPQILMYEGSSRGIHNNGKSI